MGRHVLEVDANAPSYPVFNAAAKEAAAYRDDIRIPVGRGRHAAPVDAGTCGAYVLVAGKKHPCTVSLAGHQYSPRHEHPLYGKWENAVYDLDKYRKKLIRY